MPEAGPSPKRVPTAGMESTLWPCSGTEGVRACRLPRAPWVGGSWVLADCPEPWAAHTDQLYAIQPGELGGHGLPAPTPTGNVGAVPQLPKTAAMRKSAWVHAKPAWGQLYEPADPAGVPASPSGRFSHSLLKLPTDLARGARGGVLQAQTLRVWKRQKRGEGWACGQPAPRLGA